MEFFTEYGAILIIIAAMAGFFMAWGVGANDVANAMGTSVGSKALTIKQAILIAMVFEFAGAYLAGWRSHLNHSQRHCRFRHLCRKTQ